MRFLLLLLLTAGIGCQPRFLDNQLAELRAEIAMLEKEIPAESPLWVTEGENAFSLHLEDYSARVPDFVYRHLIVKMAKMGEDEFVKMAQPAFSMKELFDHPADHRGKVFHVQGTAASLVAEPFNDKATPERKWIYSGAAYPIDQPVLFHVIDKPDVLYIGSDHIEFYGIFLKIFSYPTRNGPPINAPFFICKTIRKYY